MPETVKLDDIIQSTDKKTAQKIASFNGKNSEINLSMKIGKTSFYQDSLFNGKKIFMKTEKHMIRFLHKGQHKQQQVNGIVENIAQNEKMESFVLRKNGTKENRISFE